MQFLTRLEPHRFAGSNADLGSGAGVATDTGFARTYTEDAKAAQLNAITGGQSLLEPFKDRIHRRLGLGAGQTRALNHMMDDVLFNQRRHLEGLADMPYGSDTTGFAAIAKQKKAKRTEKQ